ncbi:hypothetical protein EXT70_17265 [Dickeya dadantii]|nr:hypothetical protein [Dickeya dadantii]NPE52105.1 hypothetical protein [Dickeya dadantii]
MDMSIHRRWRVVRVMLPPSSVAIPASSVARPYPIDFKRQKGGNRANPQELTSVSDWGERGQPTHLQLEIWRV